MNDPKTTQGPRLADTAVVTGMPHKGSPQGTKASPAQGGLPTQDEVEAKKRELLDRLKRGRDEIGATKQRFEANATELEQAKATIKHLEEAKAGLETELDLSRSETATVTRDRDDLRGKHAKLSADHGTLRQKHEDLTIQHRALREMNVGNLEFFDTMMSGIEELIAEARTIGADVSKVVTKMAEGQPAEEEVALPPEGGDYGLGEEPS